MNAWEGEGREGRKIIYGDLCDVDIILMKHCDIKLLCSLMYQEFITKTRRRLPQFEKKRVIYRRARVKLKSKIPFLRSESWIPRLSLLGGRDELTIH